MKKQFRKILLLAAFTLSVPVSVFAVSGNIAGGNCEDLLGPSHLKIIRKLFQQGLDDDEKTVGYYGLTQAMLEELIKNGRVQVPAGMVRFQPSLTTDHILGRKLMNLTRPDLRESVDRSAAIHWAKNLAAKMASLEIILQRLKSRNQDLNDDVKALVWGMVLISDIGWDSQFKLSYTELLGLAMHTDIPVEEPLYTESDLSLELQKKLNFGQNVNVLTAYQKLRGLALKLGFPTAGLEVRTGKPVKEMMDLFRDLPPRTGYVVGLKKSVLKLNDNWDRQEIDHIKISDLSGLEPLGQQNYDYLNSLAAKTSVQGPK